MLQSPVAVVDVDIMTLAESVRQAALVLTKAVDANRVALASVQSASEAVDKARSDLDIAQNALVVAAGGQDRSCPWPLWQKL